MALNDILKALDKVALDMSAGRKRAFTRIGFIVKAAAVKNAPVDTGNLRGSAFANVEDDGVSIGFTASYAASVHEMVDQKLKGQTRTSGSGKGNYWDGGSPKFLERAVNENRDRILEELKREQLQ